MTNLNTTSQVISFARQLEDSSTKAFETLIQVNAEKSEVFKLFIKENKRNIVDIERAYYGTISDALEGCFAFDMDVNEYTYSEKAEQKISFNEVLQDSIELEEMITRFYTAAAQQSQALMADVPRAFSTIVKKRSKRLSILCALTENME